MNSPTAQLDRFLAKFTPQVAAAAKDALARMRKRWPGAIELVYDNYNALAIGFAASERASDAVFSIAVFPRWVTLCFLQAGAQLSDPKRLLKGSGRQVRHIRLTTPADVDSADVRELMKEALALADVRIARPPATGRIVIKSISARQRPRRPAEPAEVQRRTRRTGRRQ